MLKKKDEWIKTMLYIYTMEYYSAIKKSEIMPFAATRMKLEMITLSKSKRQRQIPYDITYMWNLKYGTMNLSTKQKWTHRHREQTCGCQGVGEGEGWTESLGLVDANYYI